MKKTFSLLLKILGVFFIGIALLCAWGALNAFVERAQHGAGLMFADAEIFLLLTIMFLLLGVVCVWTGKKLNA
jgi:cell division protein FtsX